jgi:hypothetical protein
VSTFVPATVVCPSCGRQDEVQLAESLNVTRTPTHRDWVMDETFQRFACAACGTTTVHMHDFLYIDFDAKLFVGVMRPHLRPTWAAIEHEADEAFRDALGTEAPTHARDIGIGFRVRTVFGLDALREKIVLDQLGVDDIDLEVVKLRLLLASRAGDASLDPEAAPRLVSADGDRLHLRRADGERVDVLRAALDDAGDPDLDELRRQLTSGSWVDVGRVLTVRS